MSDRLSDAVLQHLNHAVLQCLGKGGAKCPQMALRFNLKGLLEYVHVMFVQDYPKVYAST
jgi:hypothetical protein